MSFSGFLSQTPVSQSMYHQSKRATSPPSGPPLCLHVPLRPNPLRPSHTLRSEMCGVWVKADLVDKQNLQMECEARSDLNGV